MDRCIARFYYGNDRMLFFLQVFLPAYFFAYLYCKYSEGQVMEMLTFGKDVKADLKMCLIIYDLSDDKRRRKFARFLESYGVRVQESAFEFCLNKRKYRELLSDIPHYIETDDNVRIYPMSMSGDVLLFNSAKRAISSDVLIC